MDSVPDYSTSSSFSASFFPSIGSKHETSLLAAILRCDQLVAEEVSMRVKSSRSQDHVRNVLEGMWDRNLEHQKVLDVLQLVMAHQNTCMRAL